MLENNTLWKKIKSEYELNYSDLEQYLYTKDYLRIQNLPEYFNYNKDEYNDSFYLYSFVTKKYDDYDDLFFQNFIDGNIPKEEYFEYEYKAIKMLFNLFEKIQHMLFIPAILIHFTTMLLLKNQKMF